MLQYKVRDHWFSDTVGDTTPHNTTYKYNTTFKGVVQQLVSSNVIYNATIQCGIHAPKSALTKLEKATKDVLLDSLSIYLYTAKHQPNFIMNDASSFSFKYRCIVLMNYARSPPVSMINGRRTDTKLSIIYEMVYGLIQW